MDGYSRKEVQPLLKWHVHRDDRSEDACEVYVHLAKRGCTGRQYTITKKKRRRVDAT